MCCCPSITVLVVVSVLPVGCVVFVGLTIDRCGMVSGVEVWSTSVYFDVECTAVVVSDESVWSEVTPSSHWFGLESTCSNVIGMSDVFLIETAVSSMSVGSAYDVSGGSPDLIT